MSSLTLAAQPLAPLLLTSLLWPPLLGLRSLLKLSRPTLDWLWISAAWPALALVVFGADASLRLDAWLLGGRWELDAQRRLLLAFTALLWALASWSAPGYLADEQAKADAGDPISCSRLRRFGLFWPLTLCGNLLLLVAEDIGSFYLGFALMTFSAYALVIHSGSRLARSGGFAYMVMAALGEAMILAGLLWGAGSGLVTTLSELRLAVASAAPGLWIGLLLWLGFGVKAGVIGLHTWLPLAHPVAPTPASAVLSGAMIKAGMVGWLSTLPLGRLDADPSFHWLGLAMLCAGLAGAFAAALIGVLQRHPKAVLAYSSVSQMGLLAALVSLGLLQPQLWSELSVLVVLFAAHHGMNKGALFLGAEISRRPPPWPPWLLWTLLTLPALSLAGALGSGLVAKWESKSVLAAAGDKTLVLWLSLAAVGTTALMARTLWRQWCMRARPHDDQEHQHPPQPLLAPMPLAWLMSVLAGLSLPLWSSWYTGAHHGPPVSALPGLLWPPALGLLLSLAIGWSLRRMAPQLSHWLPAGDIWWPLAWCGSALLHAGHWAARALSALTTAWVAFWVARERDALIALDQLTQAEGWLRRQLAMLLLAVAAGLAALLLLYE